jgi:PST family polysaccharide transporter
MIQLPSLISVPGLICGMFLAPQLVFVFLGPSWMGISRVFAWVCFGGVTSSLYGSASWLFTSQGRGRDQMKWAVITSAISVVCFVIGIRWGAVGVASIAGSGFVLIQTPLIMWAATKVGPVSAKVVIDAMKPLAVAFVVTSTVLYLYSRFVHMNAIIELALGLLLTCAIYFPTMLLMPSGRELLSGTSALAFSYLNRFRANSQSGPA